jgi:hypothetical protein
VIYDEQLPNWESFLQRIGELRARFPDPRRLLFRGLRDATRPLSTTLERHDPSEEMLFSDYYRIISAAEPQIQSFRPTLWEPIAPYPEIEKMAKEYDQFDLHLWGGGLKALGYMAHLRHCGFPSPLLDWTRSPYVAAFLAFREANRPTNDEIAICAYCDHIAPVYGLGNPRIFRFGPNVRTHRRHHLQQGAYTACLFWENGRGWRFIPHERILQRPSEEQDVLWRLRIPWSERLKALRHLYEHNVHAFSLFDSEEAHLETLAYSSWNLAKPYW